MTAAPVQRVDRPSDRRRGFTLLEITLSLSILAMILLATQSMIRLAAMAIPDGRSVATGSIVGAKALDQFAGDIAFAQNVTTATATAVEVTVADRNGDGISETIRYEWSGVAGDPLYRTYNHGTPVAVASPVYEFALTYDTKAATGATPLIAGNEQLLASYSPSNSLNDYTVKPSGPIGQYIIPTLPANAVSWDITRVKIQVRSNGPAIETGAVQILAANSGSPSSTILESTTMTESGLTTTYAWQQFNFSTISGLSPYQGICLVVLDNQGGPVCDLKVYSGNTPPVGACSMGDTGSSGTTTWGFSSDKSVLYFLYGTVTTAGAAPASQQIQTVACTLRIGTDSRSRLVTRVRVPNGPVAP